MSAKSYQKRRFARHVRAEYRKWLKIEERAFVWGHRLLARQVIGSLIYEWSVRMPQKPQGKIGLPQVEFINRRLNDAEKQQFDAWLAHDDKEWSDGWVAMLDSGYKFSQSRDQTNLAYIVSVTCWVEGSRNYGLCLVSRANDPWKALQMAVFKVRWLWVEIPWKDLSPGSEEG